MKIFITGAESFIGKELIRKCAERNIETIGIDTIPGDNPNCYIGDIRDRSVIEYIPENIDAIVHLAALSRDADCKDNAYSCFDVNVMGTLNLIEAAKAKGSKQFIFASSEWVYDQFDKTQGAKTEDSIIDIAKLNSEYALSKLVSEANLRQKYLNGFCPATILRFGIIYGPRANNWSAVESILHSVATKNELIVGSLKTGRHFIHVTDVAKAIILAIGLQGFEILNIQYDQMITLGDIIDISKKLLNKNPSHHESTPDKPNQRNVSNEKAKELLGWQPTIDLETGLRSVIEFLGLSVS
ncbi:MAG: NAD-dependent epimerase/dehydratase family protein [Promethearchaeota archaeon]|jgi:UDP-glucose 4-epimerase